MNDEARRRIEYLNEGPWIEKGRMAWEKIAKQPGSPKRQDVDFQTQLELSQLLRDHWTKSIVYDEGILRDSFDEALTLYQLYELAIETGYIKLPDIKERIARELTDLLWSDGARRYLQTYGYTSVIYLAKRVGIDLGFKDVAVPPLREGSESKFASFLSQHVLWYEDPILDGWLGFLDDYEILEDEEQADKSVFQRFLRTEQETFDNEATLWMFVAGAERFVTRVADLADSLSDEEKPNYGLFYAYWTSKFYGYALTDYGYVQGREVNWSEELRNSVRIKYSDEKRTEITQFELSQRGSLEAFKLRDVAVQRFWDETLSYLKGH